jgi:hypothetical protein
MPEPPAPKRRPKRFLSAEQKYEIWLKILTGELTTQEAALQAGVDRTAIMTLRKTAKDGAIAALQASRPGRPRDARRRARQLASVPRTPDCRGHRSWSCRSSWSCGESSLGLSGPVRARVDGAAKDKLLAIVEEAMAAGWSMGRILPATREGIRNDCRSWIRHHILQPGRSPIRAVREPGRTTVSP